ncbi:hypothetical protein GCM10010336_20010 [Streptomyces goshikiensis]|nr:hypothetical protein GCM10010336_20010 [Streptomyces goshikiensis]
MRRVGSLMRTASALFRTYETVARETPARRATSALVGTGDGVAGAGGMVRRCVDFGGLGGLGEFDGFGGFDD